MKICDLTQFYSPVSGGVKRYVAEKRRFVLEHTRDEHVLVIPGETTAVHNEGQTRIYTIRSPLVSRTSRYRILWRLGVVERILEREKPHIIESGDPYQMAWKAVASGESLRIPVVGFYHSHFPEAYLRSVAKFFGQTATEFAMDGARRYIAGLYNRFARTIVPSPALGDLLASWGVTNIVHTDLGVDTVAFSPEPDDGSATRYALGIPCDRTLLLYVGRLAPEKNICTLFDMFRVLDAAYPKRFHLLTVGDGTGRAALETLRSETDSVTWLPYCEDSLRLGSLYRTADLFVHPGVQETFGLVALESQACGTPVIGIRGSYMDRIIHNDQTVWATDNTPEALAEAVVNATASGLPAQGASVAAEVRSRYAWQKVFDRLFRVYREVASP